MSRAGIESLLRQYLRSQLGFLRRRLVDQQKELEMTAFDMGVRHGLMLAQAEIDRLAEGEDLSKKVFSEPLTQTGSIVDLEV